MARITKKEKSDGLYQAILSFCKYYRNKGALGEAVRPQGRGEIR